ncbi:MAG TPA: TolC family outer membrane protein [Aliidongia sp.]|nr:TolC family outer membrane protein [Aliidongia sp.]
MNKKMAAAMLGLGLLSGAARAESLKDVLGRAYANNAEIAAQRYSQRAIDEQLPQALSGWRPTATLTGDVTRGRQYFNFGGSAVSMLTNKTAAVTIAQPLYRGGAVDADIDRAKAVIAGGQSQLASVEQTQLLAAATAYLDVYRDRNVVELNRNLVEVLTVNRGNVDSTFRVGAATETDTSQAAARLSGAIAGRLGAESQLATSLANFRNFVGDEAGQLDMPVVLGEVPGTEDQAADTAIAESPALRSAHQQLEAAKHQVDVVRGQLLPKLDGVIQAEHEDELFAKGVRLNSATVGLAATVPLYEGGAAYAQVRAAREAVASAEKQLLQTERQVRQQVTTAWAALVAARAQRQNFQDQIKANEVALRDTEKEVTAGTRTRLDTLNAQQELFGSKVNLVSAERDIFAASFQLETAIGRFTPGALGLDVPDYDPSRHLDAVKDKWFGTTPPAD